jgi:TPR repeat protein
MLARDSSMSGSKYGQYTFGRTHHLGEGGLARDDAQAVALYRLAAAQGLDGAQLSLGYMYDNGYGVPQDYAEALRLFKLASAQGFPRALYQVGDFYEYGRSVAVDVAEAIRWYRRAQAAGHPLAAAKLKELGA